MVLVRCGASMLHSSSGFDAIQDAVRNGLSALLELMINMLQLDVNTDLGHGCTMVMLAINHSQENVVRQLVTLGADLRLPVRQLSQNSQFVALSWTLDVVSDKMTPALGIHDIIDIITCIAAQRLTPSQKQQQAEVLGRLLNILRETKYASSPGSMIPTEELSLFLDALLERALSIDVVDVTLAELFQQHGAKLQAGVLLRLLEVLTSNTFTDDIFRSLRRYPRLLKSFDFVYSYCFSIPSSQLTFMMDYFVRAVPVGAVRLVFKLKHENLPLTLKGVQDLLSRPTPSLLSAG
ncbi:hypothetical protein FSARC_9922 [Fusarium sarcochroum]|uniref:Ankyrin repeat protein n=1 Tax=Fusarium sarcochroum TaxID=1208366 RepID=A0A8H4X4T7_9HYPO|nr:hypothetical protein FSARC_9922 [Fusarium sarcochroum]